MVIDLGALRNAEKEIENVEGLHLVYIDDPKETADWRLKERINELATVVEIV